MDQSVTTMIIGGVAGGVGVLVFALLKGGKKCPECGEPLPSFRKPVNSRQTMWGGWTCAKCGCECDRNGRKIEPAADDRTPPNSAG